MNVVLANPRGFCAGVDRAIEIVERVLALYGAPVYVRHEVVHNRAVVERLVALGACFVEELDQVPDGATVVFSAHGVAQSVRRAAAQRGLTIFDATCPLVTKVHLEVVRHARAGHEVILIGHAGHPEVIGTLGQYPKEGAGIYLVETEADAAALVVRHPERLAFVTQTTLSLTDTQRVIAVLRERFPALMGPRKDDICYATQNRQNAVRRLAEGCDLVLVVGSPNSSNSNRLREIADTAGVPAYLIDGAADIDPAWLVGTHRVGVTAGASAPEVVVQQVVARLCDYGAVFVEEDQGEREQVTFGLPRALARP